MQSYKRLDNLCRDMNGLGVTGYLQDMEQTYDGVTILGWKDDYLKLKHYRSIRNQIAHENNASEEILCSLEDTVWIENFYQRILNQTDPLAVYYKKSLPVSSKSANVRVPRNTQPVPPFTKEPKAVSSNANHGCIGWFVSAVMILSILGIFMFF